MSRTESETPSNEHAGVGIILEKPPCRSGVGALNDVQHASPWTAAFLFWDRFWAVLDRKGVFGGEEEGGGVQSGSGEARTMMMTMPFICPTSSYH